MITLQALCELKKGSPESKAVQKALGYKSNAKLIRDIRSLEDFLGIMADSMGDMAMSMGYIDESDEEFSDSNQARNITMTFNEPNE